MRNLNSTKLNALGGRLTLCSILSPLLPESEALVGVIQERAGANKLKNVRKIPGGRGGFFLSLYAGGARHLIASFQRTNDYILVCRIADVVTHTLGQYRLRHLKPVKASDYNFSAAQAEEDCQSEPEILSIAKEIEAHLRAEGFLCDSEKPAAVIKQERLEAVSRKLDSLIAQLTAKGIL